MLKLLPTCLLRHFLVNYLDFADLQRVIEYTHYKLPETFIETADYLVKKRGFSEKEAKIFIKYKTANDLYKYNVDMWKITQYLILAGKEEDIFKEWFDDEGSNTESFSCREVHVIDCIVRNNLTFIFSENEEIVIEKIKNHGRKIDLCDEILIMLIAKDYRLALKHFVSMESDFDKIAICAAIMGKWGILKWVLSEYIVSFIDRDYVANIPLKYLMRFLQILFSHDPYLVKKLFYLG
jgi:hypothetical protein